MILLVDDSAESRYPIARHLGRAGYDIREAGTGSEALRLARLGADAIILDVKLRDMSGFGVCEKLKADPVTAHIPVIMYSSYYRFDADRQQALDLGAAEYLSGTPDPDELVQVLRFLVSN
ncbi:MAG TPA: response regulator [Gemmataceae bacterium]|nr:response regulator [Gemmataceae bacterium]